MKPLFNTTHVDKPTTAHIYGRAIKAAPMMCPRCLRAVRALDFEVIDGDVRAICAGCHSDLLTIQRQQ